MGSYVSEPAVNNVPLRASFPAHDVQDLEREFDLFPNVFEVSFEGELAIEEHTEVLVAFNERDARFGVHILSSYFLELLECAHVQHDATLLAVDLHMTVYLPVPDGLPGLQELFLSGASDGDVICICKDMVACFVEPDE